MGKFNERLRELRNNKGLSQQELANYLKISKSSINMYERGEREPGLDALEAIADFFNVDMNYLLGKTEKAKSSDIWNLRLHSITEPEFEDHLKKTHGELTYKAIKLYNQLDEIDKEKVIERMETMLESDKYQKGLSENAI